MHLNGVTALKYRGSSGEREVARRHRGRVFADDIGTTPSDPDLEHAQERRDCNSMSRAEKVALEPTLCQRSMTDYQHNSARKK